MSELPLQTDHRFRRASPATVNKHRAHLLALWRFARKKKRLSGDEPDIEKTKEYKRIPEAWSLDEFQRLLTAATKADGTIVGIPAGSWWLALLLLMYDTGLRISAVMQLPANAMTDGHLRVAAETQKQGAEQHFRLHEQTLAALTQMDGSRRTAAELAKERLFPWPMDPGGDWRTLRGAYRKILKAAGLPHGPREMFHKLRRTSATLLAAELGEEAASKHLGHSGLNVTRRYLDPSKIEQKSAVDALPRPKIPLPK